MKRWSKCKICEQDILSEYDSTTIEMRRRPSKEKEVERSTFQVCLQCLSKISDFIQPERSKREDFVCDHKCNWVHSSIGWKDGRTDPDTKGECKTKMRCSEHCGNTVRDK